MFAWMRPNDLVWNYVVNNYLLGNDPPAHDILFWNSDTTRLPARLHADFLALYETNPFPRAGALRVRRRKVDAAKIGMIAVHWAQRHGRVIKGALLAAPPDFEMPMPDGYPAMDVLRQNGWLPTPRTKLPFPSVVAASTNDPLGQFSRIAELARAWGSRLENAGAVGHLNPAAGFGEWPQAEDLIREFLA